MATAGSGCGGRCDDSRKIGQYAANTYRMPRFSATDCALAATGNRPLATGASHPSAAAGACRTVRRSARPRAPYFRGFWPRPTNSAAQPGSCRKPPGAVYVESGRECVLLALFPLWTDKPFAKRIKSVRTCVADPCTAKTGWVDTPDVDQTGTPLGRHPGRRAASGGGCGSCAHERAIEHGDLAGQPALGFAWKYRASRRLRWRGLYHTGCSPTGAPVTGQRLAAVDGCPHCQPIRSALNTPAWSEFQ
jgi:hypothetical protein